MMEQTNPKPPLWLRVLQFPLVRLLLLGPVLFLLVGISNGFWGYTLPIAADRLAMAAVMAALGFAVYFVFVRLIEQRPVHELALPAMGRELGLGMLIGAGLYTLCVLILMVLGVYRIEGINPVGVDAAVRGHGAKLRCLRGTAAPGDIFRNVEELLGSWIALLLSALLFGFRHLSNADGNIVGALAITIEAGLLLAAAYMLTRRLWLCIGFHMAWNFTQSGIFSGSVSGAFDQPGLFKATIEGPELLTGGRFGMEATIVALLVCTTAGLVMLIMAVRRCNIVPPLWRRAR